MASPSTSLSYRNRRAAWILATIGVLLVPLSGALVATALYSRSEGVFGVLAAVAVTAVAGLTAFRVAWLAAALYWMLYSFPSGIPFDSLRVVVADIPIGLPDLLALMTAMPALAAAARDSRRSKLASSTLAVWFGALLCLAIASSIGGLAAGYPAYAVLIDLRTICYLCIGYVAGRTAIDVRRHARLVVGVLITTVVGFSLQQFAINRSGFELARSLGAPLENIRDIYVGGFAGRYGTLFAAASVAARGASRGWWMVILLGAGLLATAGTFTRTYWAAMLPAIVVVMLLSGWRGFRRLLACITVLLVLGTSAMWAVPDLTVFLNAVEERVANTISPPDIVGGPDLDTVSGRLRESEAAIDNLETAEDWIVGAGFGISVHDPLHPYQHNSFAWLISKQGVVGVALFTWVVVLLPLWLGLRTLRDASGLQRVLLIALVASTIGDLVSGLGAGQLTYWPYMPLVGMRIAWIEQLASKPGSTQ